MSCILQICFGELNLESSSSIEPVERKKVETRFRRTIIPPNHIRAKHEAVDALLLSLKQKRSSAREASDLRCFYNQMSPLIQYK